MALTTMTLKSSEISDMNAEICFINRSTEASFPVCIEHMSIVRQSAVEEAHLEESSNGESSDTSIIVVDELLHVEITRLHRVGMTLSELGEGSNRGELESSFRRREEELQDCEKRHERRFEFVRVRRRTGDGSVEFGCGDITHLADRSSSFVIDHIALVLQISVDELKHLSIDAIMIVSRHTNHTRAYQRTWDPPP